MEFEPQYEPHFTAFIDLLGFSEASKEVDESRRQQVLALLLKLSTFAGDSSVRPFGKGRIHKPAISSFSDHIVVSYPLRPMLETANLPAGSAPFMWIHQFVPLLTLLAKSALDVGFLVRGAATLGNLYHAGGVVFGEALVEVVELEKRMAFYPRVVLSQQVVSSADWDEGGAPILRDSDGIYHVDYFAGLLTMGWAAFGYQSWLDKAIGSLSENMADLRRKQKIAELSKWTWFAHQFRSGLERQDPLLLKELNISLDAIPSDW